MLEERITGYEVRELYDGTCEVYILSRNGWWLFGRTFRARVGTFGTYLDAIAAAQRDAVSRKPKETRYTSRLGPDGETHYAL